MSGGSGRGRGRGADVGATVIRHFPPTLPAGYLASRATPLRRYEHCEREARNGWQRDGGRNLFGWMCEPKRAGSDRIAEVGRQWQGRERPCARVPPVPVRGF